MRKLVYAAVSVVFLAGAIRADDAEVKAIVEKAIKAHGGTEVLNKFQAMSVKEKGKFYGMGAAVDYTLEMQYQAPDKERLEIRGENFKFVQVVNGDKGWVGVNEAPKPMDKDQLAEAREELYAANLVRLTPLNGEGYKLSSLGEVKVGDRPAVGVRVEHKGHRDVNLFFDKENGLLVKVEGRGKDLMAGGKEYTQEVFYSNYKKVEGMQVPFKTLLKRDGERYVESETTEATPAEKLDASMFGKP
jgi:outer membrane lipoprotein-sorting protein